MGGVAFAFGMSLLIAGTPRRDLGLSHQPCGDVGDVDHEEGPTVPFRVHNRQIIGAFAGAAVIFAIANGIDGFSAKDNFAANDGAPRTASTGEPMIIVEIVFTALLVFVVLSTTTKKFTRHPMCVVVGLTLT